MSKLARNAPLALLLLIAPPAAAKDAAGPAPIDRAQIVRVVTSSTSSAEVKGQPLYVATHLTDGRDWSAWGSRGDDRAGAWLEVRFRHVQYVSRIEFVPGDARNKGTFAACGRPAKIRVESGASGHTFELADRRYRQVLDLPMVLAGQTVRLIVEQVHPGRGDAGVCISEVKFFAPLDPLTASPGLALRINAAMDALSDDSEAPRGRSALLAIGAPAVPALLAVLDESNPNLASRAAETLGEIGDRGAIAVLSRLTRSTDSQIRQSALWAVATLQSTDHFDAVKAWFDDSDGPQRDRAFDALARTGDPRALDTVIAELLNGDEARRESAETYLGRFGADGVRALQPLLDSGVTVERAAALRALGTVDLPDARERLFGALLNSSSEIRAAAVLGLARRGDHEARRHIRERWESRYAEERAAVAVALGRFRDPADLEILDLLTDDASMSVRRAACRGLGAMGPAARPRLKKLALRGPDGATARTAARALLSEVEDPAAAVELLASFHQEVRAVAAEALGKRGAAGREALFAAVLGDDDAVRGAAGAQLRRIGPRVLPELLAAAETASGEALPEILEIVADYGAPEAAPFAIRVLRTAPDLTVRRIAVKAVARCGRPHAVIAPLMAALDDPSIEVQQAAVKALGELHAGVAVQRLMAFLDTDNRPLRRAAIQALGLIRQQVALDALTTAYHDARFDLTDAALREDIVVAIGQIGGRQSLPVLFDAMEDDDLKVRRAAEEALK